MAYIGRQPRAGNYTKIDTLTFDGSTASFTLQTGGTNIVPVNENNCLISISGVIQEPSSAYTVAGSTITFTETPSASDTFFGVVFGDALNIGTPSDGTVTTAKLSSSWYHKNNQSLTSISFSGSENALLAGPVTVSGTITIPSGGTLVIV